MFGRGRRRSAVEALGGVDLHVGQGEVVALLGRNGSGKSTVVSLVLGLDEPTEGEVSVLGGTAGGMARRCGRVAAVRQSVGLDRLLTVRENLALHAKLYGADSGRGPVEDAAALLGVGDRLDDRVGTLSGGLARRADLARAAVTRPALLVLDEPEAGLDVDGRRSLKGMIGGGSLVDECGSVLMATHDVSLAAAAGRVVLLDGGLVAAEGPPSVLFRDVVGGLSRVRAPSEAVSVEMPQGLSLHERGGELIAAGDGDAVASFAGSLAREGFEALAGPTTLEDVYAVATGHHLADDGAGAAA